MVPVEALKLALSKESASIELYKRLSIEHTALAELFQFLINEEYKHKQMLEKKIEEITRG